MSHLITTFDISNQGLENIPSNKISYDNTSNTLNIKNINFNNGTISGVNSFSDKITTNNSIKVSSSNNLGLSVHPLASNDDFSDDSLTFNFNSVSYGTSTYTPDSNTKIECSNYYFKGLENNAQFLIEFSPFSNTSFSFNKNSGNFFEFKNGTWTNISSKIYFGFSEGSFSINSNQKSLLSITKINDNIYFNIQNYYT